MRVVGDRHEGQRQGVRRELGDDRVGVLVGEDSEDDVHRSVVREQRGQRAAPLRRLCAPSSQVSTPFVSGPSASCWNRAGQRADVEPADE